MATLKSRFQWPAPVRPWEEVREQNARVLSALEHKNAAFEEMIASRIAAREVAEKAARSADVYADAEADEAEAKALHARQEAEQRLNKHNAVVAWLEGQMEAAWKRQAELEAEVNRLRGYPRNAR